MQLPDENIEYQYSRLVAPPAESWTPLAELQAKHLLADDRVDQIKAKLNTVRGQVAAERELQNPPPRLQPLQAGFIDLPQKTLDNFRRKGDASELGRTLRLAQRLKENTDRVVVLGIGGSYLGAKALFDALCHAFHNELPAKMRMGKPRVYFEGNNLDNDALAELLEMLENACVDPDLPEERWGAIVISKSGGTLETAAAYRAVRAEMTKFYGPKSDWLKKLLVPVTGPKGKLRDLAKAEGIADDDVLTIPDEVGGRYSVFTPVGLLPAAVMGLDVRALLLGAAAMTKRFLEEPFDRNPVLQFAAVNHLMTEELGKTTRVMAVWSKKLESVGFWYDQLLSESLGKNNRGATPVTSVYTRDLHSRGQQHQEGTRDKVINNLIVRQQKHPPIVLGMADRNEDDLNQFSRKSLPDILDAAFRGTNQAYADAARPTADLVLPGINEHVIGQLMQMLMIATVMEGRLMGINPYGQPGVEAYKKNMMALLKASPNLPKGEVADQLKGK
ncbi:MAG: glucose-6-phosphate isomerase [Fimbriiglobus sp.]|jgi:glucose-6-phosphate isomerase|nr:glucose-6-phosphate isomerase [Fimbriiglobus sp.]